MTPDDIKKAAILIGSLEELTGARRVLLERPGSVYVKLSIHQQLLFEKYSSPSNAVLKYVEDEIHSIKIMLGVLGVNVEDE